MTKSIPIDKIFQDNALIDTKTYEAMYQTSIDDPEKFWGEQGKRLDWIKPYTKVKEASFIGNIKIKWFYDGVLNACYNCIDRHLETRKDQVAIIWEGDEPGQSLNITYGELHQKVCKLANALRELGINKGDRVAIYLPMIPEVAISVLACARIGAIHSVIFAGFSPDAVAGRIQNCEASLVITADEGKRGNKAIPLKMMVDSALQHCPSIKHCLVVKHIGNDVAWHEDYDLWYHDITESQAPTCPCEPMNAEDPLFILFTSGSTGTPKGVLHTTGGYLVYAAMTHQYVFDYHDGDIYWCTADVGWITGHSYVVYGPLANGATTLMFEGVPNYPDYSRYWQICDKYSVTTFYTAPTAVRALMREGTKHIKSTSRRTLRLLGSVGEPINPEAWRWYYEEVGNSRCPIVDTWWQTETGGILITPLAGAHPLKPGSASKPFFGIQPEIMDDKSRPIKGEGEGNLCIVDSWPGQMRSLYGDHTRFIETYFSTYPGYYFTGDGARRDADGDYWIIGRVDDVINVSGHRVSTAELESVFIEYPLVAEVAVVGFPHEIKGEGIYAFVTLMQGEHPTDTLTDALKQWVREKIGPFVKPDIIQYTDALPKTRSGKIMRRILRHIANKDYESFGDTTTMADPEIVESLVAGRKTLG